MYRLVFQLALASLLTVFPFLFYLGFERVAKRIRSISFTNQANEIHQENDTGDGNYHFHIRGSEDDMRLQLNVAKVTDWYPSYNIAPTNSALIIYMTESGTQFNAKYILEPLKFGIVPSWAKPSDSTPVGKGTDKEGSQYSRELGECRPSISIADVSR